MSGAMVKLEDETWTHGRNGEGDADTIFDGAWRVVAVIPDIPPGMTLEQLTGAREKVPAFYERVIGWAALIAGAPQMLKALKATLPQLRIELDSKRATEPDLPHDDLARLCDQVADAINEAEGRG